MNYSIDPLCQSRRVKVVKWALLSLSVLLAMLTISSLRYVDRFYVEQAQLLEDPVFLSGKIQWKQKGRGEVATSGNRLTITNNIGSNHIVFQNVVVDTPSFYQFEFDAGVKNVEPTSDEDWARASVAIIFRDTNGERTGSTMLADLVGSQAIKSFSEKLLLRESLGSIDLAFRLYNSKGQFTVANPIVSRLQEFPFYQKIRSTLVFSWFFVLAILIFLLVRLASIRNLFALAFLVTVALAGVVMPEGIMTAVNQKIAGLLPQSLLTESRRLLGLLYDGNKFINPGAEVSKIGHFLIFTLLGIFAGFNWQKIGIFFAIISIASFAFVTEALQMLVNGRTTSVGDLITDVVGGFFGLVIGIILVWCVQAVRKLKKIPDPATVDH